MISLCLAQVLFRVGLFPGPPPLGSLVALGCLGILWLDPSRQLRSARAGPPPRAVLPLFLPEQTQKTITRNQGKLRYHSASLFVFPELHLQLVCFYYSPISAQGSEAQDCLEMAHPRAILGRVQETLKGVLELKSCRVRGKVSMVKLGGGKLS